MKTRLLKSFSALVVGIMLSPNLAAQDPYVIDDFEGANKGWATIECYQDIRNNEYPDAAASTGSKVLFTNRGTGNPDYSGAILNLSEAVTGYRYAHLKMYRNNTAFPNLKVSDSSPADLLPMTRTAANKWQDVVFDISRYKDMGISMIMIMVDRTASLEEEAWVIVDDVVLSNDPTPRFATELPAYDPVASLYCEKEVTHFNIEAETASKVLLSISNSGGASLSVTVAAVDPNDPIDFLQAGGVMISNTEGEPYLTVDVPKTNVDVSGNISLDILWSKLSSGGNWMLQGVTVPYYSSCDVQISDTEKPVMVSAELIGEPTYSSVTLKLSATDNETVPVVKFIVNDADNNIVDKALLSDAEGNVVIEDLQPSTTYNLVITAQDNVGLISDNSETVTFTTADRQSECSGDKGHFAPADAVKRIHYEITYSGGNVTYTITPVDAANDVTFANIQINGAGYEMTLASDGKSASYSAPASEGSVQNILFVFAVTGMPGNEMTAENCFSASAIYYKVGDCSDLSGLSDSSVSESIKVYPNPVADVLYVQSETVISRIVIRDMMGKEVKSVNGYESQVLVNTGSLTAGNYILTIIGKEGSVVTQKIIKL